MQVLQTLRERYQDWRLARRRRKLMRAYAAVGRARYDIGPGLSPTLYAYNRVIKEGLAVAAYDEEAGEAELVWTWPNSEGSAPHDPDDAATDGGEHA